MRSAAQAGILDRRWVVQWTALAFFVCFLVGVTGQAPPQAPQPGAASVDNHERRVAIVPRHGTPARVSATAIREAVKSHFKHAALGVPSCCQLVVLAATEIAQPPSVPAPRFTAAPYLPRGPPQLAS